MRAVVNAEGSAYSLWIEAGFVRGGVGGGGGEDLAGATRLATPDRVFSRAGLNGSNYIMRG